MTDRKALAKLAMDRWQAGQCGFQFRRMLQYESTKPHQINAKTIDWSATKIRKFLITVAPSCDRPSGLAMAIVNFNQRSVLIIRNAGSTMLR